MYIYLIILFLGIGFTLNDHDKASLVGIFTSFFGTIAIIAFKISDGSHFVAVISGLILTAPLCLGFLWLLVKLIDAVDGPNSHMETKSIGKRGTVSIVIDDTKNGVVRLDEPIGGISEFPASGKNRLAVGTRVIVNGWENESLVVKSILTKR